jgi:MFS family permease
MIGLSAAMTPLGIIASAPLIPAASKHFGPGQTALACAALSAVTLALIGWSQDLALWFPLRFLLGVVINPLYVLSEVWMITLAPPARRGRLLGLYAAIISIGFALGPLCLALVGSEGAQPFIVGVCSFVVCGLCLALVLPKLPGLRLDEEEGSMQAFLPLAPVLLAAVFVAASFEQSILSLMPVYGVGHDLPETRLATLLTVFVLGNIALQVPFGFAAERYATRTILVAGGLITGLGCLLMPLLAETPALWPLAFALGALSYGLYTIALVELGTRFTGSMLVAGNAAFAMIYGVGGLVGSPLAGAAMDAFGVEGLPLSLAVMCFALSVFALNRR